MRLYDREPARWCNAGTLRVVRTLPVAAVASRLVRRFVSWPTQTVADPTGQPVVSRFEGTRSDLVDVDTDAIVAGFADAFRDMLREQGIEGSEDRLRPTGGRVLVDHEAPVTVAAATLVLVDRFYPGHPLGRHRLPPSRAREFRSKAGISNSPASALIAADLWSLAAHLLVRLAHSGRRGVRDWTVDVPGEHQYVVPARLRGEDGNLELWYRPRASVGQVAGLLRRYGRRLLYAPGGSAVGGGMLGLPAAEARIR